MLPSERKKLWELIAAAKEGGPEPSAAVEEYVDRLIEEGRTKLRVAMSRKIKGAE